MLYGGGFGGYGGFPPMYGVNPFQALYAQLMQQQAYRPSWQGGGMPVVGGGTTGGPNPMPQPGPGVSQSIMQPNPYQQFSPNQLLAMQAGSGSRAAYLPFNTPVGGMHGGQMQPQQSWQPPPGVTPTFDHLAAQQYARDNAWRVNPAAVMAGPLGRLAQPQTMQLGPNLAAGMPTGGIMADYGNGSMLPGMAGRAPQTMQLGPPPPSSIPYVPPGMSPQPTPMQNMGFPQRQPGGFGSQPGANGPAGWGQPQVSRWSSQGPSPTRPQWRGPGVGTSGLGFS